MKYIIPVLLVCNLLILTFVVSLFLVDMNGSRSKEAWTLPPGGPTLVALPPVETEETLSTKETVSTETAASEEKKMTDEKPSAPEKSASNEKTRPEDKTFSEVSAAEGKAKVSEEESPVSPGAEDGKSSETPEITAVDSDAVPLAQNREPAERPLFEARPFLEMEKELFPLSEPVRNRFETPTFKRRLPTYFKAVGVTEAQAAEVYRIQEDYFRHIVFLQMRIDRLATERDKAILQVLTEEQQTDLQARKDARKNKPK